MLMEWGINKANELVVECFLMSTAIGVPLYHFFKFQVVDTFTVNMTILDPSPEWKEWEEGILLHGWHVYLK